MDEDRAAQLDAIAAEVRACTQCRLHEGRTNGVPGYGDPEADIMFIGEGPGQREDEQGLPFVGRSGQYLDTLLKMIGLKREQVFIANVVKCRPPGNRDPAPDEINTCTRAYLFRQIEAIDPLVIATLGRFSMGLYFPKAKISAIHGQPRFDETDQRAYYPFFHPAAVLRNPGLQRDMEADFHKLLRVLQRVRERRAEGPPKPDNGGSTPPPDDKPPEQLPLF